MKYVRLAAVTAFLLASWFASPAATSWHHPLYLGNGGFWPLRIPVKIENSSPAAVAGEPVTIRLPALVGLPAESVRVCDESGQELLFEVRDQTGAGKRSGRLTANDSIILPAECPAGGSTLVWVYAGNERALPVPDYLAAGLANGGFEAGQDQPSGWSSFATDDQHTASLEPTGGRGDSRCVTAKVAQGAEATWVQWRQDRVRVVPGRKYRLAGWVRAENVTGQAGWFVHVAGERPMLINRVLDAGSGSYDFKRVAFEFVTPETATHATIGTVLHGTGQAWFDDVEFAELEGSVALKATVGLAQRLALLPGRPLPPINGRQPTVRAMIRVVNPQATAVTNALVVADVRRLRATLRGHAADADWRVTDPASGSAPLTSATLADEVVFTVSLPPLSVKQFHLALVSDSSAAAKGGAASLAKIIEGPGNLAPNPGFENGDQLPDDWLPPTGGGPRTKAGCSSDAPFGSRSAEFSVPADVPPNWVGWRSREIPVKPGIAYIYAGYLKSAGLSGSAQLHAHLHDATGKITGNNGYLGTQPAVSGDSDWQLTMTTFKTPLNAASIQLHLTMNATGALRHDGILLAEVLPGEVIRLEGGASPAAATGLQIWPVNPLVKVFPDDPPGEPVGPVEIECARNEYEPFQLVLRSGTALQGVQVSVSALAGAQASQVPSVKVDRVGYVPIDHPSGYYRDDGPDYYRKAPQQRGRTDGWAGMWPDPLLPNAPFDLRANEAQPLWFTVQVPKETLPGDYRGSISVSAAGRTLRDIPLTVRVLPFTLPETTRLKAIFDFRFGPGGDYGSGAKDPAALRRWLRFIADHRLGIDRIDPPPRLAYQDGRVTMDTAEFDEAARFCLDELKMSVAYTPWQFYAFGWAYTPKKFFGLEPFTPEYNEAFKQMHRLFAEHIKARGWADKFVYYISDEPHFDQPQVVDQMRKLCALAHAAAPDTPIYSSTWRHCPAWDNSLDIWGVGQYGCFPVPELEALKKAGKKFWFTCDGQMATDTPYLATERMLPYYCYKYGAEGFEFWGLAWWTYNPWERGWHWYIRQSNEGKDYYWIRYPNGDGYLAYPGQPIGLEGPLSTIRLEQVREGLEDYEVIKMLEELGAKVRQAGGQTATAEKALAMARDLVSIPNAGGVRSTEILPDPDRIPTIRRALNAALVELIAPAPK